MDQLILGIGTRLQHTLHGPGVIVGIKYGTYLISFIDTGIKEIDKSDEKLEDIYWWWLSQTNYDAYTLVHIAH